MSALLGNWSPPMTRERIEEMLTPLALGTPRHRLRVVCTFCGTPTDRVGLHRCPLLRCEPVNDDRRQPLPATPEQCQGVE